MRRKISRIDSRSVSIINNGVYSGNAFFDFSIEKREILKNTEKNKFYD